MRELFSGTDLLGMIGPTGLVGPTNRAVSRMGCWARSLETRVQDQLHGATPEYDELGTRQHTATPSHPSARSHRTQLAGDSAGPLPPPPPPAAAMADRGGKGFSSASKGKSLASRPGAPNGRQNSSANIPHVTIDSDSDSEGFVEEVTPRYSKSNGKAASESLKTGRRVSSFSKGEAGKGGAAYSAGKGRKGSASNAMPTKSDADLKLELDIPPNSRMLMNCEAAELLQEIHEHMAILSEDPKIKIPESFDKAFQYAKDGNHFTTAKSVKQVLDPLKKCGVNDGEICLIANIGPETIEEVYALVPSLRATRSSNEGPIMEALTALANMKAPK